MKRLMNYPGSLHNHTQMSNFRLKDCIIKEDDLIERAIELGHSVIAITDHESISSAVRVEKIKNKVKDKIKVINGNEIYLCRNGLNNENFVSSVDKYYHFILLAKDAEGFKQICELSTRAWMRSYMGKGLRRVPTYYSDIEEIVGNNPGHLIGCSACLGGALGTQILQVRKLEKNNEHLAAKELWKEIISWCEYIKNIFGGKDNFYLELQPSESEEQTYVNQKLLELSKIVNLDYIITCDTHYLKKEDRFIHKAYLNASEGERETDSFYATTYLMDTDELCNHLDLTNKEIENAFQNIIKIQNLCKDYSILKPLVIPTLKWNDYSDVEITKEWVDKIPYFQTFLSSEYQGDQELVKAIIKGIEKHPDLQNEEAYKEINNNLEMTWISSKVNNAHWSAYYLNLQRIIDLCWEAGSLVGAGRGSGVGFILLYCLGITQINPLLEETKTYAWRFLNPERVSVLDIDFDIEGSKRQQVLNKFRQFYGEDRVANVLTLRSEKSKSAILTAARGLGIEVDEAQYLASLIPADRGQLRTLREVYYGDEEKGFKPISSFVKEVNRNYQELWEVALKIEGLISGVGIHAGGIIFVDEPFTNSTALMRAPDGTIITQFDLHDAEEVSLIKYDALSVEAMDKIHVCLDLLIENEEIEPKESLRETYESVLGIYNLNRTDIKMWEKVWNNEILSLFQMEQESGIKGIALTKPKSVEDLAHLNSVIRLMAQEKGEELPLEKYARFKNNIELWFQEMKNYGLTKEETNILIPLLKGSYGICEAQEMFMTLVQLPECGGYNLNWADKLRKAIAKKNPMQFDALEKEFYENIKNKNLNYNFCNYVWRVLISTSKGYGFNLSHTLAYSLIALQEMNLAYKFPILYWNTACLIVNSGSLEDHSEEELVSIYEPEAADFADGITFIDLPDKSAKIRKTVSTDYSKMAKAIGDIMEAGIKVSLVDINKSGFSFKPDITNNQILFGMKGLLNVSDEFIQNIISNRPYSSPKDFLRKVNPNKQSMISLIKGGAFDNMMDRKECMVWYLWETCDKKKRITLQNMRGLINYNLIPQNTEEERIALRIFEFNRYIKAFCKKNANEYLLDNRALDFISKMGYEDIVSEDFIMKAKSWDKYYQAWMDIFRGWISNNKDKILEELNTAIFKEAWEKYAKGNISAWEMEALCFYYHEHELANVNQGIYGFKNFYELPAEPIVERSFIKGGKEIKIYELSKICGTCIAKNKSKSSVSLLTTSGVVNVKFRKEYFSLFDKQISEKDETGAKKVREKSWFNRGSMIVVQGIRSGDDFIAKKYASTHSHQLYKIEHIDKDGILTLKDKRYGEG